ncbi:U32 family peptidase [bacterium]|nr:U32 family peptidase [bacterium]
MSAFKRQKKIKQSLVDQPLLLKEELRKNMNIILEDNHGTYLFNGYNTSCLEIMKDLKDLDSLLINGFMHDQTWVDSTINIYYQLLNKKTNLKNLIEFRNKINKTTTNGFLNAPKGLLNLQTTNNEK